MLAKEKEKTTGGGKREGEGKEKATCLT